MDIVSWRILLVDDDEEDYQITCNLLARTRPGRCEVDWAQSLEEGRAFMLNQAYDAVLVDYFLGASSGMELVRLAVSTDYPSPILVLTGRENEDLDMQVLQAGASDYLSKNEMTADLLERSIRFAVERKQNERILKAANARLAEELEERRVVEGRLRRLLETSYEGIWIIDNEGNTEYVNPRGAQILGYQVEEVLSRPALDFLFSPEHVESALKTIERVGQGFSGYIEAHTRHKNGSEVILLVSTGPIQGERGEYLGALAMFTDITERRRTENHARFLADLGNQLIASRDPEEIAVLVSERVAAYLGALRCSVNEGEPVFSPKLPQGQTLVVENTATDPATAGMTLAGPLRCAGSFVLIPHQVDSRQVAGLLVVRGEPSRWHPDEIEMLGSVAHLAWLALDHSRSARSLRQAEERFKIALANTQMTVFTMDRELRYTWVHNPSPSLLNGDITGRRDDQIFPPEVAEVLMAPKRQVIESERSLSQEVSFRLQGREFYFNLSMEPQRDDKGAVTGLIAAALDISHLRILEAQQVENSARAEAQRLLNQQREMERLELARDLHDGPLQEIIGASIGLADAITITDPDTHLSKLSWVREILQRQAAEMRLFCQELRPPTLASFGLEKAIRSHQLAFQERNPGVRFYLDLMPDRKILPEETRLAFFRIYQEALNNIARHSKATEVLISLRVSDATVALEIRDNGAGFVVPQDWVAQARTNHFGLLGMRERAAAVGAALELISAPGAGTAVRVMAPV